MTVTHGGFQAPPAAAKRRAIAPWWVALLVLGTGATLGFIWFVMGGLPFTNHAAYGRVEVPGSGTVSLPAAEIRIFFEEDGVVGEDDSADMPDDLQVVITGPSGTLAIERIPEFMFSSTVNNTGHVPYGLARPTSAGTYQVTTVANEPTSALAPRVTFGEPPINPFGPLWVGALILLAPFAVIALILVLPLRRR